MPLRNPTRERRSISTSATAGDPATIPYQPCPPPLRWAGGKRFLVKRLAELVPRKYGKYYEPMVGSGALFFALRPAVAILSDVNPELIHFLKILKSEPELLYSRIREFAADRGTYYEFRTWKPTEPIDRAARFFYLVRLSWNGLYRVNKQSEFNVPFGGRTPHELTSLRALSQAAMVLRGARLRCGDFEGTTGDIEPGDFVYLDPPYPKGASNGNGFARYSSAGFKIEDHERLASYAARLARAGVRVMVTEAARENILRLYPKSFNVALFATKSLIAGDKAYRRKTYEAVLRNYST